MLLTQALKQVHFTTEPDRSTTVATNGGMIAEEAQETQESLRLFNSLLQLYMKKIDTRLEMLEEWESSILNARKEIEEGRKSVIAEKIRNVIK